MKVGDMVQCNYAGLVGFTKDSLYRIIGIPLPSGRITLSSDKGGDYDMPTAYFDPIKQGKTGWQQMQECNPSGYKDPSMVPIRSKPVCDCGSKYTFGNVHSDWCSLGGEK